MMCSEQNELKKAWLNRYLDSKRKEKELLLELEKLESDYILPSKVIDDMPHGSAGDSDLSAFAAQYDHLYHKIKSQLRRSMIIYSQLVEAIDAMPTGEAPKTLLHYRYILGYTWERIAVEMNYSFRHVLRLHGEALSKFAIPKQKMS